MRLILFTLTFVLPFSLLGQYELVGKVILENKPVSGATVLAKELNQSLMSEKDGTFHLTIGNTPITLKIQTFSTKPLIVTIDPGTYNFKDTAFFQLELVEHLIEEVVVSGQLKEVNKLKSVVPVEIYSAAFFHRNPSLNIYDALQNINGIRPQVNCNICNTGDIHINGLEGPYTMVLIDGMPVMSSLASVYGLTAIPNSLIERLEIIRGPSSSLYGSEAIGGVINVITKSPDKAPKLSIDILSNTWLENGIDLGFSGKLKKIHSLTGVHYFNYSNPTDNNKDGFTDVTLQERISIFQKIKIQRKDNRSLNLAARYLYEDRWGGQTNWTPQFRGSNLIYGESIYTGRWEVFGNYALPMKEKIIFSSSFTSHNQNSFYGSTAFMANQKVFFQQLTWYKKLNRHDLILGSSFRQTLYNDNTTATSNGDSLNYQDHPEKVYLPGLFIQDDWSIHDKHTLLLGLRYDHSFIHGDIFTPRFGYKWDLKKNQLIRLNMGSGYRVVSVFTEDHASLTGARKTIIEENLRPERSNNIQLNYYATFTSQNGHYLKLDISSFYTRFENKIIPDYLTDPTKIIFSNLSGYAENCGLNLNTEFKKDNLKISLGGTLMNVSKVENHVRTRQLLTEKFTGTWTISYSFPQLSLDIDYTGNIYSPMLLPILGTLDPRPSDSPWWSIQNVQFTYKVVQSFEFFTGVKNLLNWLPGNNLPFLIARSSDPFNKTVEYNADGTPKATSDNPYGLVFDPTYVYGPNQGIRIFVGIRYALKK